MRVLKFVAVCVVFIWASVLSAQNMKTSVKISQIISEFNRESIQWAVPISQNQQEVLQWYKRENSLEKTENIRTFVAYKNQSMVGVVSVFRDGISGSITINNEKFELETSEDGFLIVSKSTENKKESHCGSCASGNHSHKVMPQFSALTADEEKQIVDRGYSIPSDGVMRVYRLAMFVTNNYFTDQHSGRKFNRSVDKVKAFWAETETTLNEMYQRDLSVRFEIVNNENLISKTEDEFQYTTNARNVYNQGTRLINGLVGKQNYDVGLIVYSSGGAVQGLGETNGVYQQNKKANCCAIADPITVAHEVGHLFGSLHTFTFRNLQTYYSEPGEGMSVMSYGFGSVRDYFSLISIGKIRQEIQKIGYYSDEKRTQLVKGTSTFYDNYPYGIKKPNTRPVINTHKIKKEYRIPQNTYFQFYIPAVDKEQKRLNYYAHQVGDGYFPNFTRGEAKFNSYKPTQTGYVAFEKNYGSNYTLVEKSEPTDVGTFDFWLAVNDADANDKNSGVFYDEVFTRVKIETGTAFKITEGYKTKYTAGEKVTLKWSVDRNFFDENSKVRILLSDDFGQTYKYILAPSVPNNGTAEITIPNITLGKRKQQFGSPGLGIIKVEVIDHIAHAITENNIMNGGFEIQGATITFQNTPEPTISAKEGSIPQKAEVTATSTCSGAVNVAYSQQETETLITRTWTATDNCNKTATFVQHIYVQKNRPLSFVENLPQDLTISHGKENEIPEAQTLTATGGCQTPVVAFSEKRFGVGCTTFITRTWTATSDCTDPISHTQTITLTDNIPVEVVGELPQNKVVRSENEIQPEVLMVIDKYSNDKREEGRAFPAERTEERKTDSNGQLTEVIYKWTATDFCGNVFEHKQIISVVPSGQTPPIEEIRFVDFPANVSVNCKREVPTSETSLRISGCSGTENVSVTSEDVETGDCKTGRTIERTYTASACGKSISQTQTITIAGDNVAPTFVEDLSQNEQVTRNNLPAEQQTLTATDNCSQNVSVEKTRSQENNGVITETWTARDDCGNQTTHSRTITIVASELSFVNPPSDMNVSCPSAVPTASKTLEVTANCNPRFDFKEEKQNETCKNSYTLVRTWTATDNCGNSKTHTQRIVVSDTQSPEFEGDLPKNISVKANEIPQEKTLTARDNCSGEISVQPKRTQTENIITEIWTAIDECGNEKTHTRRITILPEPPAPTPPTPPSPTPIQPTPPNEPKAPETKSEVVVYNWVSEGTGNHHLKIENVEGKKSNMKIFNELGQLVFEVSDYDNRQNVFIGEGNIGGRKRLASGVYFYILTYKQGDVNHSETGFLVLKN